MNLYFIETKCFAIEDRSLFLGTFEQLVSWLDNLSALGWMVAAAFEVATDEPVRGHLGSARGRAGA